MAIVEIIVLVVCGLFILLGILLGASRGFSRSLLRFIFAVVALVCTFVFQSTIVDKIFASEVAEGVELKNYILDTICTGDLASFKDVIWPILYILVGVVIFLVSLFVFKFLSLIVYGIFKLILVHNKEKKGKLLGGLIGLVSGVAFAFVFGCVVTGLSANIAKLASVQMDGTPILETAGVQEYYEMAGFEEYNESSIAKIFSVGKTVVYDKVSTATIDDKEYTLDGQVDGLKVTLDIAGKMSALTNTDFSGGLNSSNVKDVANALRSLSGSTEGISEEAKELVNELVSSVSEMMDVDLSNFDIEDVNFEKAADLVEDAYSMMESTEAPTQEEVDKIVKEASESGLVKVVAATGMTFDLDEDTQEKVESSIDDNDELTEEEKEELKKLFGLKKSS